MIRITVPNELPKRKGRKKTEWRIHEERIDKPFGEYIRLRDSKDGWGKCCTCSKFVEVGTRSAQAGHYMTRDRTNTRWEEKNCNLQCGNCNGRRKGMQDEHGVFIDEKYGKGAADELRIASKMPAKYSIYALTQLEIYWKKKLSELKEVK